MKPKMMKNKRGFAPLIWLVIVAGTATAVGFGLFQFRKATEEVGAGWLGIPLVGWIIIILLLLILLRSRRS